jgi:hypothetical protein
VAFAGRGAGVKMDGMATEMATCGGPAGSLLLRLGLR